MPDCSRLATHFLKSLALAGCAAALLAGTPARATDLGGIAEAATEASCLAYLATNPNPAGLAALTGPGASQRAAFLADGGKLVAIGSRYYTVWVPPGFYTATRRIVVFDLHGTGGYPEAEWNDWHTALAARGYAFIGLAWGGGTPGAETDATIYTQLKQIAAEVGTACPLDGADKWLMGFSVGSAVSFAIMVRDVADQRMFRGQIAVSGAAIGPLTTGRDVMHATVEAARSNGSAVLGIRAWMYCGELDFDHGWGMCTEMPNGQDFVNTHGGSAYLYRDASGGHHSLPTNVAAYEDLFGYIEATTTAPRPASGWWWNPSQSGRGFAMEVSGNTLFMAAYLYDGSGRATWYASSGRFYADGSFSAPLDRYAGGQTLTGSYQAAALAGSDGTASLNCASATTCTLTWPGGTVPLQRFVWSLSGTPPPPANTPQTGWWWNPAESGRGFFLEVQGDTLLGTGYMYDASGNPIWYYTAGSTASLTYQGQWSQYANGQTLTGSYVAPIVANPNVGALTLRLTNSESGVLVLPDGREIPVTRFRF